MSIETGGEASGRAVVGYPNKGSVTVFLPVGKIAFFTSSSSPWEVLHSDSICFLVIDLEIDSPVGNVDAAVMFRPPLFDAPQSLEFHVTGLCSYKKEKKERREREREKQGKERHGKRNIFGAVFTGHALRVTDIENRGRGGGAPNEIKKMQKQKEQLETRQVKA